MNLSGKTANISGISRVLVANGTSTSPAVIDDIDKLRSLVAGIAFILLGIVGTAGALLCLAGMFSLRKSSVKSTADPLFLTLCLNVLIFSLFCCPLDSYSTLYGLPNFLSVLPAANASNALCQALGFANFATLSADVLIHGAIALHRFFAVVVMSDKFVWLKLRTSTWVLALAPWTIAGLALFLPLFRVGGRYGFNPYTSRCGIITIYNKAYYDFLNSFTIFTAIGAMVFCYSAIVIRLVVTRKKVTQRLELQPAPAGGTTANMRRESALTRTAFALGLLFLLCYLPSTIYVLLPKSSSQTKIHSPVGDFLTILLEIGCVCNPWLIMLLTPALRRSIKSGFATYARRATAGGHGSMGESRTSHATNRISTVK